MCVFFLEHQFNQKIIALKIAYLNNHCLSKLFKSDHQINILIKIFQI